MVNVESVKEIEQVVNEQKTKDNFFNKKNYLLIGSAFLFTIILIVVSIIFILDIDFNGLFSSIKTGLSSPLGALWFFLLFIYVPFKMLTTSLPMAIRVYEANVKVPLWSMLLHSVSLCFLAAVTPANFVTDPYNVFWLKTLGFSNSKASSIVWSNAFLWHSIQMVITLPSFIIICTHYGEIVVNDDGLTTFWFIVTGLIIDFFIFGCLLFMGLNKRFHFYLSATVNWVKKMLKLKYHTIEETKAKYMNDGELRLNNISQLKHWKGSLTTVLIYGVTEIFIYALMYWSILFILPTDYSVNFCDVFNVVNTACTANKFIPIPGGEGTIEVFLTTLLKNLNVITPSGDDTVDIVNNSVFVWRTFSIYIPALLGMFGFGWVSYLQFRNIKNKKIEFNKVN